MGCCSDSRPAARAAAIVVLVANLRARPAKLFRIIEAYYMADNKIIKTVGDCEINHDATGSWINTNMAG
jgi:hypothetical protein